MSGNQDNLTFNLDLGDLSLQIYFSHQSSDLHKPVYHKEDILS